MPFWNDAAAHVRFFRRGLLSLRSALSIKCTYAHTAICSIPYHTHREILDLAYTPHRADKKVAKLSLSQEFLKAHMGP